jgi:formamidopyrimidine-DNA glycosylase
MPELAEVAFYCRRWMDTAQGCVVKRVHVHAGKRVFRERTTPNRLQMALPGSSFVGSRTSGKQMLFEFSDGAWLGLHLGMTGELTVQPVAHVPGKHDHLVLYLPKAALVFTDPRMFGRIRFDQGAEPPAWWQALAPDVFSPAFNRAALTTFLARRRRTPIKAVLLLQERFPGIGNWMADEILWRSEIHPRQPAGSLAPDEVARLWRETRHVCRAALEKIAGRGGKLPPDLNIHIPQSWLFHHRWRDGGRCPKTGAPLARAEIGGRTTCWSPARQALHR